MKINIKKSMKIFSLTFLAALIIGPTILHSQFGIGVSPILTGSMRPYANPGDVFITKEKSASQLKVGDVISVHSQETGVFYAHRISEIRVQSNLLRITTKGDANKNAEVDPFMVTESKPVSAVVMRLKWIGRPLVYLTSIQGRQGAFSLMIIANFLALLLFLFKKKKVFSESSMQAQRVLLTQSRAQTRVKEDQNNSLKAMLIQINNEKLVVDALLKVQHDIVKKLQLKEI